MIGQGNAGEPGSIASATVNNNGTFTFNRVEDLTYAGTIGGTGALSKQAAGTLTLAGTNSYLGPTTISAGTLLVNGVIGNNSVTATAGTLGGSGIIKGPVSIQSGGRLALGPSLATLTISNSLTLAGTTTMKLNAIPNTNDSILGLTTVTYGGSLTLTNLTGTITGTNRFKLFSASNYTGTFISLTPSPGPNLAWNTNTLAIDGTLRVVSTVPTAISALLSSNLLALSWPADHIGWRLQVQTNSVTGANWSDIPTSINTNQIIIPFDPANSSVFYRLLYR
jgi:autotransporter-associated beta strand protein